MNPIILCSVAFFRPVRSGYVMFMISPIAMAVASLPSVCFLTDRLSLSIQQQANELLAADLRIRSPAPIPSVWVDEASSMGLDTAISQSFPTVIYSSENSGLARIKAVSSKYPLRGQVRIANDQLSDEYPVKKIPNENEIWLDESLLYRLNIEVGDSISIGNSEFTASAVLKYRPDQSIGFASLSTTILMNIESLPATGLITQGSRVNYSLLIAGEDDVVESYSQMMEDIIPNSARISDPSDSSERTNQAINRAKQFLSLTIIISV